MRVQLSVIVPMYNEARHIVRTLRAIWRAAARARLECEIIVVDNGSTDAGPGLARAHGANVMLCPGLAIGALRNAGAARARGQWLAFLDADIEVPEQWLVHWKRIRHREGADVFALDCIAPPDAPWFARAWQRRSTCGGAPCLERTWLPTPNLCMERSWFERVGGFDAALQSGEDKDLGLRLQQAGARQLSQAHPAVLHWGFEASWSEWLRREFWRQGSHLRLLATENAPLRVLRFPLLCLLALVLSLFALSALGLGFPALAAALLTLSALPPLGLALRQSSRHRDLLFTLQLWLLHWLRLHVGAVACIFALIDLPTRRPERG